MRGSIAARRRKRFRIAALFVRDCPLGSSSGNQDLGAINKFSAAVAAIHDGASGPDICNGLSLIEDFRQGVSVVEVLFMGHGRHNDTVGLGHGH